MSNGNLCNMNVNQRVYADYNRCYIFIVHVLNLFDGCSCAVSALEELLGRDVRLVERALEVIRHLTRHFQTVLNQHSCAKIQNHNKFMKH